MELEFVKMQGIGNDYIYFDCLKEEIKNPNELSIKLSDRHFGIGGDGIVLICPSEVADAKMRMFNLDGSEGKMCGNAIRCVGKYLYDNKITAKKELSIETLSGIKYLWLNVENGKVKSVKVDMGAAVLEPSKIPAIVEGEKSVNIQIEVDNIYYGAPLISMGNPHCVIFTENTDELCLEKIGKKFENHKIFPEGVNTEFVEVIDKNTLKMRVWERGSGETLACGTGACAVAVAAVLNGKCEKNSDIKVILTGGELIIKYTDKAVYMTGEAEKVFQGVVEV